MTSAEPSSKRGYGFIVVVQREGLKAVYAAGILLLLIYSMNRWACRGKSRGQAGSVVVRSVWVLD